ncbi:putative uncharacterized protein SPANXA2-OT1 [Plecturocebus cupreus]
MAFRELAQRDDKFSQPFKKLLMPGMVAHTCNPSTLGSRVGGSPELHGRLRQGNRLNLGGEGCDGVSLCCPGWGAMERSRLTATFPSQVQAILLPQPPEQLGLQVSHLQSQHSERPRWTDHLRPGVGDQSGQHVETGFHHDGQAGLKLLTSTDLPALVSQSKY